MTLETAYRRLGFLVSPRLLHHLRNGQFESITSSNQLIEVWSDYARRPNKDDLEGSHIVEEDLVLLDELYVHCPHLLVLTEDICLIFRKVGEVFSRAFNGEHTCTEALDLHKVSTKKEIWSHLPLQSIYGPAFFVALFDTNRLSCLDNSDQIIERFLHIVNNMNLGMDKHVIFIGIVRNSSIPSEIPSLQFHLHFHRR